MPSSAGGQCHQFDPSRDEAERVCGSLPDSRSVGARCRDSIAGMMADQAGLVTLTQIVDLIDAEVARDEAERDKAERDKAELARVRGLLKWLKANLPDIVGETGDWADVDREIDEEASARFPGLVEKEQAEGGGNG